jgi:hypothetical protein
MGTHTSRETKDMPPPLLNPMPGSVKETDKNPSHLKSYFCGWIPYIEEYEE